MTFSQIEYFLVLADCLNYTSAAKLLYISQPALSKQISLLEQELDAPLFIRSNKQVLLTRAGEQLKEDFSEIMSLIQASKARIKQLASINDARLRIACFDGAVMSDYLPQVVETAQRLYPDIDVDISRGSFDEVREMLEQDKVDIAFTMEFEQMKYPAFETKQIARRRHAFIYSDLAFKGKKPRSVEDFSSIALLVCDQAQGSVTNNSLSILQQLHIKHDKIVTLDNFTTLLTYLELGNGYAVLGTDTAQQRSGLELFELPLKDDGCWVIAAYRAQKELARSVVDNLKLS